MNTVDLTEMIFESTNIEDPRLENTRKPTKRKALKEKNSNGDLKIMELSEEVKELKERNKEQEEDISKLFSEIKRLTAAVSNLEAKMHGMQDKVNQTPAMENNDVGSWATVVSRAVKNNSPKQKLPIKQVETMNSIVLEQKQRDEKKQNVIIFGFKKGLKSDIETDKLEINKLFESIDLDKKIIKSINRFKSKKDEITPVIVTLDANVNRNIVLGAARKLLSIQAYKGVYINPDMTEAQRYLDFQLRSERKRLNEEESSNMQPFRWGIRGENLRRFKKDNK